MKANLLKIFFFTFFFSYSMLYSQSYIGYSADNYSGVHSVIYNPSTVVNSRLRMDINIISASSFAGSDYFSIDLNNIIRADEGYNIGGEVDKTPLKNNQFFTNIDVLGPSLMFNIDARSSLAITSRVRGFFNLNNINGRLYDNLTNDFTGEENFIFEFNNFSGTIHAWGEFGLTYGRILIGSKNNSLKGGLTIKYLQGAGTLFTSAPNVQGNYNASNEFLTTTGSLQYGSSEGFNSQNIEFSNLSSGFGADVGFIYEYRPISQDSPSNGGSIYDFKIGVSITDIGSISYDDTQVNNYNLNNSLNVNTFQGNNLENVLAENYEGTEQIVNSKINLPTALHLFSDYNFRNNFYISLQGSIALIKNDTPQSTRVLNTLTATPRLETRWFSFYLPLSIRQYDGFAMGAGLRLGPLVLGSGSVFTNLLLENSRTTDVYVALKIPFYQKENSHI